MGLEYGDITALYERYRGMVLRRCRQMLRDEKRAEDAAQEVFVRFLRSAERLTAEFPSSLLYRMATHHCLNLIRDAQRQDPLIGVWLRRVAECEDPAPRLEARSLLARLFGKHEESTRTMAVLHLMDGMTLEEVALEVGLSVSGVRKRLRAVPAPSRSVLTKPRMLATAFGLLVLAMLMPRYFTDHGQGIHPAGGEREDARLKGQLPALYLYKKTGAGALGLKSGERVRPGELIQMYYHAAGRAYGAIFSLDGNGDVTWHLPDGGGRAVPLASGGKVPLGFAFELDSLPGFERFFFVAGDRPFDPVEALKAIGQARLRAPGGPDRLPFGPGISQLSLLLIKETGI
jgi:RNA polymerase sigma-70 factor, ECF subfamily